MDATSSGTIHSSDTHTGSSSSKSGSLKVAHQEEEDFSKDNAASPIDLECHIQADRITKILDEALYKTKLAICLPQMVQNYKVLSTKLTPEHMDDLVFIFEQYDNPLFSASLLNIAAMDDIKSGDVSLKNRLNPELGHLLYIMNSYPELRTTVDEMIQKMKMDYAKQSAENMNPVPPMEYLLAFEKFQEQMVTQMDTTAAEELTVKLNTKKLEGSNEKLIQKIQEVTALMQTEQKQFEELIGVKQELIAELEKELGFMNITAEMKLKKKVLDSDRQMVLMSRSHAIRHEMLKEEEIDTREGYENLLNNHLMDEKTQRARRFKVETQLLSWLQKYDVEMSDKQMDLDELEDKYISEQEKCEVLEKKLAVQDLQYLPLMKERDEEYHAELTAKMQAFQLEHAVRVIQIAWRDVLANRAEKRKLKKIWNKVKLAREKEERRLEKQRKAEELAAKKAAKEAKKKKRK